jgi:hypothetical protein
LLYIILTFMGKILGDFSVSREQSEFLTLKLMGIHLTNSFQPTNYVRKSRDGCISVSEIVNKYLIESYIVTQLVKWY